MSEATKVVFNLADRDHLEGVDTFFKEVKEEFENLVSNAWFSRMESRAMRMLVHQLGGGVRIRLMTEEETPKTLSIWTNGLITTSDDAYYHPVETKLLALAPDMFDMLVELQGYIEGGGAVPDSTAEHLQNLINQAKP